MEVTKKQLLLLMELIHTQCSKKQPTKVSDPPTYIQNTLDEAQVKQGQFVILLLYSGD